MAREFLMGNEAMALGALASGLDLAAGYPGTPSTEVLETIAKRRSDKTYVEWSVNEKAALEAAAGAAYSGARVLVTMKQVGLNVASDPLMSLAPSPRKPSRTPELSPNTASFPFSILPPLRKLTK